MSRRPRRPYGLTPAQQRTWRALISALAATREAPRLSCARPGNRGGLEEREISRLDLAAWKTFERFAADLGLTASERRKPRPHQLRIPGT